MPRAVAGARGELRGDRADRREDPAVTGELEAEGNGSGGRQVLARACPGPAVRRAPGSRRTWRARRRPARRAGRRRSSRAARARPVSSSTRVCRMTVSRLISPIITGTNPARQVMNSPRLVPDSSPYRVMKPALLGVLSRRDSGRSGTASPNDCDIADRDQGQRARSTAAAGPGRGAGSAGPARRCRRVSVIASDSPRRLVVPQEQLLQRRRLADQAAYADRR